MSMSDYVKSADFKTEKHVPVIDAPAKIVAGQPFSVAVTVGKDIPHPNVAEHFIAWVSLFYKSDDGKFVFQLGKADFMSHGESAEGAGKGPSFTEPAVTFTAKINKSGTLTAMSYCNIHGLWESSVRVDVSAG